MSLTNPNAIVTEEGLSAFYQAISPYLHGPKKPKIYGFRIDANESVPSAKVTYLEDAIGMTPAHMDYENDVFDYGSWENAFFMPKPCMLKYDGTVDYYLDPDDYTKKEDGTASDVKNTSYGGNAMMEWGQNGKKIWLKIVPDATADNKSANIYIAEEKIDDDYTDWPFHNSLGQSVDHFYTAIYNGSNINNVLRSLSGQAVTNNKTCVVEAEYALANNQTQDVIWNAEVIADVTLIDMLLILIGKSTNVQEVFGQGLSNNGESTNLYNFRTGVHNNKGLFYGTNNGTGSVSTNAVKVFGMENWWGFQHRRYLGEILINGVSKRKLTYGTEDGSTTTGYNFTGEGYIDSGVPSTSGDSSFYVQKCEFTEDGIFPNIASYYNASSSTYYCDYLYYRNSITCCPSRGGAMHLTAGNCGIFARNFYYGTSESYWYYGTSISAKPLS